MTSVLLPTAPPCKDIATTLEDAAFEPPSSKCLENRASISSVDSSISLSYDAVPFTPRSSLTNSSGSGTEDDESLKRLQLKFSSAAGSVTAAAAAAAATDPQDEPFQPPDEELIKKIVDQVEYYFSDENILKDAFLLKHVRRNKEGYVSLKLIASFKKVKHIARDWRVVRVALDKSSRLEINEAGTKLRRKDPLPLYDQTTPSRTVVALRLPTHKATIEAIAEIFRPCGEIALIRILRPGNPIPADIRPFYNKHPQMQESVSALVEFVRTESAHNALDRDSTPHGVEVLELSCSPSAKKKPPKKKALLLDGSDFSCQSGSEAEDIKHKSQQLYLQRQRRDFSSQLHQQLQTHVQQQLADWTPPPPQPPQRRWSRDSESADSCSPTKSTRSNSGGLAAATVCYAGDQRRVSTGWESGSESFGSGRSRSSSGASVPDVFHMRRYSLPRKETPSPCCCEFQKCDSFNGVAGRRYSIGRSSDSGFQAGGRPLSRCPSGENYDEASCRRESVAEFYPTHRRSASGSFERRCSFSKSVTDSTRSRSNSVSSAADCGRRPSDADTGCGGGGGLARRRSFGNGIAGLPGNLENVVRLPRGPDGSKGFQRELIEYTLQE